MAERRARPANSVPPDPTVLRRATAGRHLTGDGRFEVSQGSGGWMLIDAEQVDELGLPLVRGPFATLGDAKSAMQQARSSPAPSSTLAEKIAKLPTRASGNATTGRPGQSPPRPVPPAPLPLVTREFRSGDGEPLRALWSSVGFRSIGDDDAGLRTFAQRNPGTFLVAVRGGQILASILGGWDGRRGWIYHVATAPDARRSGIATQLVQTVEARLQALGCRKVNVVVMEENPAADAFWTALGYDLDTAHHRGRELSSLP